jgi:Rne/Rng family ribonuclease
MSRELVVDRVPQGLRLGLLDDGRLIEVDLADEAEDGVGAVCLGRVSTVAHDLGGAFVDCGLAEDAFLAARDARAHSGAKRSAPIAGQVSEGQALLVQVKRGPQAGKGPRLTTDIALAGIGLVHRPRRAAQPSEPRAKNLFPQGGFELRPTAVMASDQELLDEAARLRERWAAVQARAAAGRPPALIERPPDPVKRLLLEHVRPDLERMVFADRVALIGARRWLEQALPGWLAGAGRLEHLPDAFEASGAAAQLEEALGPTAALPSGGSLIIEPTSALTAIDVNGAGKALEIDLEAVPEVARQLRLRRIGGNVVIDFVDLEARKDRARLDAALRAALAHDPAAIQLYPMSPLGLVELSRQRIGPSLAETFGRTRETIDD